MNKALDLKPTTHLEVFNLANLLDIFKKKISLRPSIGLDGKTVESFEEECVKTLSTALQKINNRSFKFTPYLEEIKSKGKKKYPRIISKPTIRDRIILLAVLNTLQAHHHDTLKKELPNQLIRNIKSSIARSKTDLNYVKLDIEAFYDNITHKILLNKLSKTITPEARWLISEAITNITVSSNLSRSDYPEKNTLGVPQGLCISNLLSDIYLGKIDKKYSKYKYHRYVDDILVISHKKNNKISTSIQTDLAKLGLRANSKSSEGKISDGLEYLGYVFKGSNLVSVRISSKEKFIRSLIAPITRYKKSKTKPHAKEWLNDDARITILLETLNEKITGAISEKKRYGWMFYFSEINDIKLLHEIDSILSRQIKKSGLEEHLPRLKRLARAYREVKYNAHGTYIHNYNNYSNLQEKLSYLIKMGVIDPDSATSYSQDQIERMFDYKKNKNLLQLEVDLGSFS